MIKVEKEGNGLEESKGSPRLVSIDLDASEGLSSDHNRGIIAKFIGLNMDELPKDFSKAVRHISIGSHEAGIIVDSHLSGGKFSCIKMQHPKDFGPPLHIHKNEDEFFLILEGLYIYQVDNALYELKPGNLLLAPKEIPHSFRCVSQEGATLVFTAPGGFEDYFAAVAELSGEGFKEGVLKLNQQFGIQFVGPPINPSVKFWENSSSAPIDFMR